MNTKKQDKIRLILDYAAGKASKTDLSRGKIYFHLSENRDGTQTGETFIKDGKQISKEIFERETENAPESTVIWKEGKNYGK